MNRAVVYSFVSPINNDLSKVLRIQGFPDKVKVKSQSKYSYQNGTSRSGNGELIIMFSTSHMTSTDKISYIK